jgi:UDP-glucose 4-epimerase/UDP-glucuronate 4-epimerase
MALLITGGGGFVGLALAEASLPAGDEVVAFSRSPPPPALMQRIAHPGFRFVPGDVRSAADLDKVLAAAPIDRVVHAAAVTAGLRRETDDPRQIVDVNVGGTASLLAALHRNSGSAPIARVVVVSSVAVYGFSEPARSGRYREDECCPAPAALYGITKLAAEQTALRLGEVYGIDTRVVRLGPVFGPWEHHTDVRDAMSPHFQAVEIAATGGGSKAILPRRCPADWIYSRDAAAGLRAVLGAPRLAHRVYNLGGGAVTDLPAWCEALVPLFPAFTWRMAFPGEEPTISYGLVRDRAALDVGRLEGDTGFWPAFDLARAAADYAAWTQAAGDEERQR